MKNKFAFLAILLVQFKIGFSQTGIFYWTDSTIANYRLHNIVQTKEGDLYMVGITTDANDKNQQPLFIRTDNNGTLITKKVIPADDLYELSGFLLLPKMSDCTTGCYPLKLFGTKVQSNIPVFYTQPLNVNGEPQGSEATLASSPQIMGSIASVNDSENYFSFSKLTSQSVYNVRLVKEKYREVKGYSGAFGSVAEQEKYIAVKSPYTELCEDIVPVGDESVYLLCRRNYSDTLSDYIIYKVSSSADSVVWKCEIKSRKNMAAAKLCSASGSEMILMLTYLDNYDLNRYKAGLLQINLTNGDTIAVGNLYEMRSDGLLKLKNGNYVLYGGVTKAEKGIGLYMKAKWVLLDKSFNLIKEDELGMFDAPDANLPGLAMSVNPTMSELAQAVQLADGRIAFAGRVYMPNHIKPNEILYSQRFNRPMLLITGEDGKFRKEE